MAKELTNDQFGELIAQFVELQVDNMELEDMIEWITDELIYQYGKLTPEELKERVNCFHDDGLYDELVDNVTNNCIQTFIPGFHDQRSITMKWAVKLYVAGKLFEEKVHAVNYQDAKETALARNPKAKVVSVNPTPGD